ncbi:MAG: hypothetical protein ACFFFO_14675 [Candidatus Thorarchaeota archaeon]
MSRSAREIPKEVAAFGERQFRETGAAAVEVLRVKAAVMRKHFSKLQGITFLVAVVSLDRVRVYFFNSAGIMLVGENIDPSMYGKVRRASKLIAKFEKPRELTPEELRIEATQELRDSLAKSIRRVSRFLATSEPTFPDIFITRHEPTSSIHSFGLQISEDGALLFEENALKEKFAMGVITRSAFLALLEDEIAQNDISSIVGNGIALALLKGTDRKAMLELWKKRGKGTESLPLVNHMIVHQESYSSDGFQRVFSLLKQALPDTKLNDWVRAFRIIHDSIQVAIGTEDYHTIQGFCKTLEKPRNLVDHRHRLEKIHLAPRVICNPTSLDISLFSSIGKSLRSSWAEVTYAEANELKTFTIGETGDSLLTSIEYWLNIEDVYPSSGGLISHGKDVIRRVLTSLGVSIEPKATFEAKIEFSKKNLKSPELAVLERLSSGKLDVLSNTLIGSPQIVESLFKAGSIVFVPDFNHVGINPDFLVHGKHEKIRKITRSCCLEATVFNTEIDSTAVVSAPGSWKFHLLDSVYSEELSVWPVHSAKSVRKILRDESPLSNAESVFTWTEGPI